MNNHRFIWTGMANVLMEVPGAVKVAVWNWLVLPFWKPYRLCSLTLVLVLLNRWVVYVPLGVVKDAV